tara:strand:- start:947 stop:1087 length:141 start_codon:yes stop_codon:yes gene_type:complete
VKYDGLSPGYQFYDDEDSQTFIALSDYFFSHDFCRLISSAGTITAR